VKKNDNNTNLYPAAGCLKLVYTVHDG